MRSKGAAALLTLLALLWAAPALAQPNQTILDPAAPKKLAYPRIVIYTVSWCPHCRALKEYLTSHNIPFINRDVEVDSAAMDELTGKYRSTGVPLIILGNDQTILHGFSAAELEKALEKAKKEVP